jgi:hypothetical protein
MEARRRPELDDVASMSGGIGRWSLLRVRSPRPSRASNAVADATTPVPKMSDRRVIIVPSGDHKLLFAGNANKVSCC